MRKNCWGSSHGDTRCCMKATIRLSLPWGRCAKEVGRAAEIDEDLTRIEDVLNGIQAGLEDASFALRDYVRCVEIDPVRLEQVEERLDELNRLKRKYGPELEDILRLKDELVSEMSLMEISGGKAFRFWNKKRKVWKKTCFGKQRPFPRNARKVRLFSRKGWKRNCASFTWTERSSR